MQRGDYLNEDQKRVKQLIMEKLMDAIPTVLATHPNVEFDGQTMADLIIAIIIMYTRETLSRLFLFSNVLDKRNEMMDRLFKVIKEEVNVQVKMNINQNKTH